MEKRLILAIALSILVIVTFQHFTAKPPIQPEVARKPEEPTQPVAPISQTTPAQHVSAKAPSEEKEFIVETDKYILTFSNIGGSIKNIRLKDYKKPHSDESLDLVDIKDPKEYIFAISDPSNSLALYSSAYEVQQSGNAVTYSLRIENVEVVKKYSLHNYKYIIELQLLVKNISGAAKAVGYELIGGAGITEPNNQDKRFIEIAANIDGKISNFKKPNGKRVIMPGIVGWLALKSKYFSIILKPFIQTKALVYSDTKEGSLVVGIESDKFTIPPNYLVEHRYLLYAGPGKASTLKDIGQGFEETINYGVFGFISKILLSLMGFINGIVHNWGVSIILLSIILNVALFPLSLKSFKSMKKMQELHPQMEKLKTQYKDNPQKLNREIMELYKKYNINPFSGCLPLILQMPIFIALYNALIRSIDLKNAGFLWIKDLSLPDGVKIPFSLPLIRDSVNILPIFMIIAMVIQQKISTKTMGGAVTAEQKQQQQMMLVLMPIMFGFIFYNMPSGLVLYWVVNTVLTIVEQSAIAKNI